MSTKTHPQSTPATRAAKRPKGVVFWAFRAPSNGDMLTPLHKNKVMRGDRAYAVIPCRTAKEARALVKLHAMTPAQMTETMAKAMYSRWTPDSNGKHYCGRNAEDAVACLKALNLPTP